MDNLTHHYWYYVILAMAILYLLASIIECTIRNLSKRNDLNVKREE